MWILKRNHCFFESSMMINGHHRFEDEFHYETQRVSNNKLIIISAKYFWWKKNSVANDVVNVPKTFIFRIFLIWLKYFYAVANCFILAIIVLHNLWFKIEKNRVHTTAFQQKRKEKKIPLQHCSNNELFCLIVVLRFMLFSRTTIPRIRLYLGNNLWF